jgi:SAM-dependent methyltransferase
VVVGAVLGAALGLLTWAVARRRHLERLAPEVRAARPRAAARYAAASPRDRHYARFKYRLDPGYLLAADALHAVAARPDATVVDLGCGRGLLAVLLGETGAAAQVVGLDWDEAGLAIARAAARDLPRLRFAPADLTGDAPPACTAAALIDVLHYHPPEVQDTILARVAGALAPGGRLVVREADADERMLLARLLESWGARRGWHKVAGRFHYRSAAALRAGLETLGFAVITKPAGGFLHRANVLLVADLAGAGSPPAAGGPPAGAEAATPSAR